MSENQEDSGESPHYLKLPENFDIVESFLVPPAEISRADDLRFNKYVVCSNLRSLKSGGRHENLSDEFPVQDEDWRVELFGDYEEFLFDDEDGNKQPCNFERFFYRMLYELRCPSEPPPNVNIWVQFDLVSPPQIVLKSQLHWIAAFRDYCDAFVSDRRGCSTVWFYYQFMDLPATSMNGPSDVTINWVTESLSYDAIQVAVSLENVESSYDGSQIIDTFVDVDVDVGFEFDVDVDVHTPQEDPARFHEVGLTPPQKNAVPANTPTAAAPPPERPLPPLPPLRPLPPLPAQIPTRTRRGSLVSKLKKVTVAAEVFGRKVKEGLSSPSFERKVKQGPKSPSFEPPRRVLSPEAEEKVTTLTTLASETRDGGLQDPDNLLLCTQPPDQEAFFRYCCGYLPAVNSELYDNVRHVRLSHCKLAVTPYQFCTAVRILFKENDTGVGGGFLALSPGIGKTYIVLFAYALRTLLLTSRREVEIEWSDTGKSKRRKNHLPRDAPPGQRLRCPSEKPGFGVRCYCVPDGLTRLTVDRLKPGLTLIQVPNGAMPGWLSAIKDAKFEPSVYNVVLFHPAAAMPSGLQTNSGAVLALKRAIRVGATLPAEHPGGRIEHQRELDWHIERPPLTKNHMALESYCFVTTHYSSAIEEEFRYGLNDLDPRPARVTELPDADNKCYALLCGMTFVDESHQALTPASKPVQMAQIHRHIRASDIWHVTATPFGAKFENVLSAVSLLAPHLNDDLERLKNVYELARTSNDPDVHVAFECQFHLVFDAKLVIRDLETTTFLGRPITDIQPVTPKFISSVTPEAHMEAVQGLIDNNLRAELHEHLNSYADYHRAIRAAGITDELYFISLFPSMAGAMHDYVLPDVAYIDRRLGQLIRELSDTTGESIATIKLLTDAVESYARGPRSPKVQDILKEISRMVRDTSTERPDPDKELAKLHSGPGTKVDLTLKKMVIITPTLSTAVFLYLYLSRYHHSYNPLIYHQGLKASAKAAVLKKFDSLRKENNPHRVLIAPAQVAGAGLNLQVANRLILTSPLLSRSDEKQALARINRTGQTLQVHIKILIMEDSPIDRILLAERARRAILSDPFRLDEDLVTIRTVTS
ncbi:hypothetical protein VPNG_05819 [Cytospora leucostoma]|uniref:Helicase C-terminal domain-containing protein n=1 Tax=Cytospora leucostoma TaxID=1230097 RepID=A0A423X0H3_9PEZI|nr:hypothetical protein VPNG_05819 [Cytospora leucostoma]